MPQLRHIDVNDYNPPDRYSIGLDQGLIVTGRYTNGNQNGPTLIMLDSGAEGQKFRRVLQEALLASRTAM